jgi:hypothetical protein
MTTVSAAKRQQAKRHREKHGLGSFRVTVNRDLAVDGLVALGAIAEPEDEHIMGIEDALSAVLEDALRKIAKK